MDPLVSSIATVAGGGLGGISIAYFVLNALRKRVDEIEKIPSLEARVLTLENQVSQHNETKDAVIRMEEQIKHLTEQVKSLQEMLMNKWFNK